MRSSPTFSEISVSPSFLRTTPAKKPRTECCCHPVTFMMAAIIAPWGRLNIANHVGLLGTGAHYGVAGCLSGLARFRRPRRRLLWQFVNRGCDHLVVDPDRLKASLGNAQGVRNVPVAAPHRQRTAGLDLLDE